MTTMNDSQKSPYLNVDETEANLRLKRRAPDNMKWMGTGPHFRNRDP
jgi:hypothetical protein